MLYLFLGLVTVIFSISCSQCITKIEYRKYLTLTMFLLFFIWGFEYYNTVDYAVMLHKFNQVVYDKINYEISGEITYIEPGCKALFYLCSPFGNLTYYILVAFFEVVIIKVFIIKYIPQRYIWLLILLILFQFEFTTVLMTLKRQILSIFAGLLIIYFLTEKESVWSKKKLLIVSLSLCLLACSFHKSAIVTVLFIPIWYITKYDFNKWVLIILVVFYFFQYTFDLSVYSNLFFSLIEAQDEKFAHYALQIENGGRETSLIHIIIEFITFLLMLFSLNRSNRQEKFFLLSGIFYSLFINFFVMDSGRILLPFRICQLFAIPIMVSKISFINEKLPNLICAMFVVISIKSTYEVYTNPNKSSMTEGFKSFNVIFEAPSLQIDYPLSEKGKYLPYR